MNIALKSDVICFGILLLYDFQLWTGHTKQPSEQWHRQAGGGGGAGGNTGKEAKNHVISEGPCQSKDHNFPADK